MVDPSFVGLKPKSEARIAFSIFPSAERSYGCTSNCRGSGAAILASCWSGVGAP